MKKNENQNNFNAPVHINAPTQIAGGDIINSAPEESPKIAKYSPEQIWRSPFTMALLTWISVILAIAELLPIAGIVSTVFSESLSISVIPEIQPYLIVFVVLLVLLVTFFSLRRITKNQTRHPLLFSFAISGYGNRLTLEKIHVNKCPQCGGKMKYYSKPVEWRDVIRENGTVKREVTKRSPALECIRNPSHYYLVDPAEDVI